MRAAAERLSALRFEPEWSATGPTLHPELKSWGNLSRAALNPSLRHFVHYPEVPDSEGGGLSTQVYYTGEPVPESGIYSVSHAPHRLPSEVTLLRQQPFPRCEKCDAPVEFTLLRSAPQIAAHPDFRVVLFALPVLDDDGHDMAA